MTQTHYTLGSHFWLSREVTYRITPKISNELREARCGSTRCKPWVIMVRLTPRVEENLYMD